MESEYDWGQGGQYLKTGLLTGPRGNVCRCGVGVLLGHKASQLVSVLFMRLAEWHVQLQEQTVKGLRFLYALPCGASLVQGIAAKGLQLPCQDDFLSARKI